MALIGGARPRAVVLAAIVAAHLLLTVPYHSWGRLRPRWIPRAYLPIMTSDLVLITLCAYLLGGPAAFYGIPIYSIAMALAAPVVSGGAFMLLVATAIAAYAAMSLATGAGWIPEQPGVFRFGVEQAWSWMSVIVNSMGVIAIAVAAGAMAATMRRAQAQARSLEHQLRAKNAMLEKGNAELDKTFRHVKTFSHAVSHDIRNPLTAAGEALRLARREDAVDPAELFKLASENLLRADRMVLGLRDLMRTVGQSAGAEVVPVGPLIQELIAELRAAGVSQHVSIEVVSDLGDVRASAEQLTHVFRNLIRNAVEHNRDRRRLRIEVGRAGSSVDSPFFVRDDGGGIQPEYRESIFQPFKRGESSVSEGLGLGLALVDSIVSQAGGRVWVDSEPGRGATFWFTWRGTA